MGDHCGGGHTGNSRIRRNGAAHHHIPNCLTLWRTGFEPATSGLARQHFTGVVVPWPVASDRRQPTRMTFWRRTACGSRKSSRRRTARGRIPSLSGLIGSIRRECLTHVLVLGEGHLRRILARYFSYYHRARTHLALDKDAPDVRPVELPEAGRIMEIPEVGGLHHRYVRQAA